MKSKSPHQALKEVMAQPECPACVLIMCEDFTRRNRVVNKLVEHFLGTSSLDKLTSDGVLERQSCRDFNRIELQALELALHSVGLFCQEKFILLENADALTTVSGREVTELLKSIPAGVHVIVTAAKLKKNSALYKLFDKRHPRILLEPPAGADFSKWIERELNLNGVNKFDKKVIHQIAEIAAGDVDFAAQICQRLALYVDGKPATAKVLAELYRATLDPSEFGFIDTLSDRNPAKAEIALQELLFSGTSAFPLLGLINRTYQQYYSIRSAREAGMSDTNIRQNLKLKPWLYNKHIERSEQMSTTSILASLTAILTADSKLKNKSLGETAILSELADKL